MECFSRVSWTMKRTGVELQDVSNDLTPKFFQKFENEPATSV